MSELLPWWHSMHTRGHAVHHGRNTWHHRRHSCNNESENMLCLPTTQHCITPQATEHTTKECMYNYPTAWIGLMHFVCYIFFFYYIAGLNLLALWMLQVKRHIHEKYTNDDCNSQSIKHMLQKRKTEHLYPKTQPPYYQMWEGHGFASHI